MKRHWAWNRTHEFDGKTYYNLGWVKPGEVRKYLVHLKSEGYVLLRTVKHVVGEPMVHIFGRKRE